jgi:hypothetical protein
VRNFGSVVPPQATFDLHFVLLALSNRWPLYLVYCNGWDEHTSMYRTRGYTDSRESDYDVAYVPPGHSYNRVDVHDVWNGLPFSRFEFDRIRLLAPRSRAATAEEMHQVELVEASVGFIGPRVPQQPPRL